ncbi:MAG: bifunctional proline dehydrogenase/L-glutamate gamma-semialdehyde dehydrogenase, partial [Deltaproteobacteria bacterium]|nr:bifunctional proline dehydrogenase/L-glutamate gamma-semialdehyde dehydrogenase [Deltaproteobacteria bacterium]
MNAAESLEAEVRELARALYRKAAEHKPSLFQPQDWMGRMIDWSLEDDAEYFAQVDHALGGLVFLAHALHAGRFVAPVVRHNVVRLARRFIAEESAETLSPVLTSLRKEPAAFTLDVVGEATVSEKEAEVMESRYRRLLTELVPVTEKWPSVPQIDSGPEGPLPRVNLSVKLSSLYPRFDPLDPDTEVVARERLTRLMREASRLGAALTIDMEQYAFKDLTLSVFTSLLEETEFRERPRCAIALQSYLRDAEKDLTALIRWARERKLKIGVRLIKGAYWDSEIAWARQKNWPIPVFTAKAETDANYERLSRLLLENHDMIQVAFGSHNIRSIAHAIVTARQFGVPTNGYEIQMLYGMAEPIRQAIIDNGQRVRVYVPVGELLPGMAYLIRRLMENTSNTSFLRQTYAEERDIETLIVAPSVPAPKPLAGPAGRADTQTTPTPFVNEPLLDFSHRESRVRFASAIADVQGKLGRGYPLRIGDDERETGAWVESLNPANPKEIVGRVPVA